MATSNDDHDIWHQIGLMISARRGQPAPRYRDLLSTYPIERATEVERPDVVRTSSLFPPPEYFVLVEHHGVRAAWRQDVCGRERHARSAARRDIEDVDAVTV